MKGRSKAAAIMLWRSSWLKVAGHRAGGDQFVLTLCSSDSFPTAILTDQRDAKTTRCLAANSGVVTRKRQLLLQRFSHHPLLLHSSTLTSRLCKLQLVHSAGASGGLIHDLSLISNSPSQTFPSPAPPTTAWSLIPHSIIFIVLLLPWWNPNWYSKRSIK